MNLRLQHFFDPPTSTLTYLIWDPTTRDAVVIDPVIDYDPATGLVSRGSVDIMLNAVSARGLSVHWVLETHAHADHLSGARELREQWSGCRWGMGERMIEVFNTFKKVFAWPAGLTLDGLGVDRWFRDGEEFTAGSIRLQAINTPGHTPACLTYRVGEWLFTGDALFMPDSGVGRCDFPGGSAATLYDAIWNKIYGFPDHYSILVGHDYQPGGRPIGYRSTVGEEKRRNIHLRESTSKADFVAFREGRDKTLKAPRLLEPSLDWNLGAHQRVPHQKLYK